MIKVRIRLPSRRVRRIFTRGVRLAPAFALFAAAAAILLGPGRDPDGLPQVKARCAIVMDAATGGILYAKNPDLPAYPASTAKILTGLIAAEECDPEEWITVGPEIRFAPRDSSRAGLRLGDRIRMEDLIRGLMLPSGNDAAYVLAVRVGRSRFPGLSPAPKAAVARFVDMMNERARRIGAKQSRFTSPDGYHDSRQVTTARDLALIAREAMAHPLFRKIVGSSISIPDPAYRTGRRQAWAWENRNKLLDASSPYHYDGSTGIKTGHTTEAGYCLASSACRAGRELISIVLNSTEAGVWTDSAALLDFGFHSAGL